MYNLELKYGFLTSYKSTFFLKREMIDDKAVLFCSEPINYDQASTFDADPEISVRECLLYFQSLVHIHPDKLGFPMSAMPPVVTKTKDETLPEFRKRADEVRDIAKKSRASAVNTLSTGIAGMNLEGEEGANNTQDPQRTGSAGRNVHFNDNPLSAARKLRPRPPR